MTDTNQLPPLQPLQPGDSHMESLIEDAIQGHASTREAMRWLVRQLVPMQASAQVLGEPAATVESWVNGSYSRNYKITVHSDLQPGTKLYTTPQPAQAITHDVWVKHPYTVALMEQVKDLSSKVATHVRQPAAVPMTPREIELIDGMIAVQLDHAQRCDAIGNRVMGEKQKGWDMERVELLRRIKSIGITAQAKKEPP